MPACQGPESDLILGAARSRKCLISSNQSSACAAGVGLAGGECEWFAGVPDTVRQQQIAMFSKKVVANNSGGGCGISWQAAGGKQLVVLLILHGPITSEEYSDTATVGFCSNAIKIKCHFCYFINVTLEAITCYF